MLKQVRFKFCANSWSWLAYSSILVASILLLLKGWNAPFTHDESVSYNFLFANSFYFLFSPFEPTANNHIINSIIGYAFYKLGVESAFLYRLPHLICGIIYLIVLKLIAEKSSSNQPFRTFIFIVLIANPYTFEYLTLARGYSMAICFQAICFLYVLKHYTTPSIKKLRLILLCALLSAISSYTFIYSALAIAGWLVLFHGKTLLENKQLFWTCAIFSGSMILFVIVPGLLLKHAGELYFGGVTGFWEDSIGSLLFSYWRNGSLSELGSHKLSKTLTYGLMTLTLFFGLIKFIFNRQSNLIFPMIFMVIVTFQVVQHHVLESPYLMGRTALVNILPACLAALQLMEHLIKKSWSLMVHITLGGIALILLVNFTSSFQLKRYSDWPFDATNERLIQILSADTSAVIVVDNSWLLEPGLNFILKTKSISHIAPFNRYPGEVDADFVIQYENDTTVTASRNLEKLHHFPSSDVTLYKVIQ